jgi:hypothetical protein
MLLSVTEFNWGTPKYKMSCGIWTIGHSKSEPDY